MIELKIRKSNITGGFVWVIDIVEDGEDTIYFVQSDGTKTKCFRSYPLKVDAQKAADLYRELNPQEETSAEKVSPDKKQWGHPDFYKLLDQMADLHSRKNHDYAGESDPLKNLRACERLNLKPFLGVLVRLQDKWSRLEEFVKSGQLMVKDESVIDTLMDNAVYSLLGIILYQEQQEKEKT